MISCYVSFFFSFFFFSLLNRSLLFCDAILFLSDLYRPFRFSPSFPSIPVLLVVSIVTHLHESQVRDSLELKGWSELTAIEKAR